MARHNAGEPRGDEAEQIEAAKAEAGAAVTQEPSDPGATGEATQPDRNAAADGAGDQGAGNADGEAGAGDPAPIAAWPPTLLLGLGDASGPDHEIAPVEVRPEDFEPRGTKGHVTVTRPLDIAVSPQLLPRQIDRVVLVEVTGGEAVVKAESLLVTPVFVGSGNGLHLPARSLMFGKE